MAGSVGVCGVKFGARVLKFLFFADDLVLLDESQDRLQQMMGTLSLFCDALDRVMRLCRDGWCCCL